MPCRTPSTQAGIHSPFDTRSGVVEEGGRPLPWRSLTALCLPDESGREWGRALLRPSSCTWLLQGCPIEQGKASPSLVGVEGREGRDQVVDLIMPLPARRHPYRQAGEGGVGQEDASVSFAAFGRPALSSGMCISVCLVDSAGQSGRRQALGPLSLAAPSPSPTCRKTSSPMITNHFLSRCLPAWHTTRAHHVGQPTPAGRPTCGQAGRCAGPSSSNGEDGASVCEHS